MNFLLSINFNKMLGLIWIQIILHSDGNSERILEIVNFEKSQMTKNACKLPSRQMMYSNFTSEMYM